MTPEEALYWKGYIDQLIADKCALGDSSYAKALEISRYADSYLELITGQQYLPQGVFREFLRLFADIPAQQEALNERIAWIKENLPFEECSEAEIYAMFEDEALHMNSLTEVDDDGYAIVPQNIPIDEEGYIRIAENISIDEDGYLIEN